MVWGAMASSRVKVEFQILYFLSLRLEFKVKMEWPLQSPDLNPIEQLWDHLDRLLRQNQQASKEITWKKLQELWQIISVPILKLYDHSMNRRCEAVILAKGGHTKY